MLLTLAPMLKHAYSLASPQKQRQMPNSNSEKDALIRLIAAILMMVISGWALGCTEVVVPGALIGGGEYYHYTTDNIAKETLTGDVRAVTAAARSALRQMDVRLHSVTPYTDETIIRASTVELNITIKVIPVTASTSQVIVDAREDHIIIKDKATADEILSQIRLALASQDSSAEALSRVFIKNNCPHPVYVAVRFLAGKNEPAHWITRGWFVLSADQTQHIADTHNRFVYFYAETRLKDNLYWGGDNFHWFEGQRFGFFKADFGNETGDLTQTFSCQ